MAVASRTRSWSIFQIPTLGFLQRWLSGDVANHGSDIASGGSKLFHSGQDSESSRGTEGEGRHSSTSGPVDHYKAAVIGAGPAGLAVVATLLDYEHTPILWIDPHFDSGRLSAYKEVPSNTKVKLFQQFVTTSPSLSRFSDEALAPFQDQDPNQGCPLALAGQMVKSLTHSIRHTEKHRVHCVEGNVKELTYSGELWHLDTGEEAECVYLATGSQPRTILKTGVTDLELDTVLAPSHLPEVVGETDIVGVVGSSHSAILALKNLVESKSRPRQQIVNFYRSPLLFAQYMDNWILYDNTGLKGAAADWAKEELASGKLEKEGVLNRVCVKGMSPEEQFDLWRKCSKLVQAVGYERNKLPKIIVNGQVLTEVEYDPHTGKIADGLFGFGIAFPEQTTDPYGNQEFAVGLWKFMRYVRATITK